MRHRVLIVEDVAATSRAYQRVLELASFEVHAAPTAEEALTKIAAIAFHVVTVDLGLDARDPSNYSGFSLVREISNYDEGTRIIVVSQKSGGRSFDIAVEAFESHRLARWLRKGHFSVDEYVEALRAEAAKARLKLFRNYTRPLEALLHDLDSDELLHRILETLQPRGGYSALTSLIDNLLTEYSPLRPRRDARRAVSLDSERQIVTFSFWSRALGTAVLLDLSRKAPPHLAKSALETKSAAGLTCLLRLDPATSRQDYAQ